MLVIRTETPEKDAARRVNTLLDEYRTRDVLLLLSGGSAFVLLPHFDTKLLSERITVSVLDERYTFDDTASNFAQLAQTPFFEQAQKQRVALIDPRPEENESLRDAARRFDLALKHWHITHHDGIVVATMGIGHDGHTSGVLPDPENPESFTRLFLTDDLCVRGYHVNLRHNPHPDRMTTTLSYLQRHVHHVAAYAVGEEKRKALEMLRDPRGALAEIPARIMHGMHDVELYTDLAGTNTAT